MKIVSHKATLSHWQIISILSGRRPKLHQLSGRKICFSSHAWADFPKKTSFFWGGGAEKHKIKGIEREAFTRR